MLLFSFKSRRAARPPNDAGYVLLAVIFMTFMVLLSLAIAAPRIATSIQRQKELETIHRGEQYKRAIQLYYRKFGRYPTSIDQLVNTNNIRFLRKRYTDPLTGKDDWKLVRFGQAHVRPLGFFGQPLGTGVAGGLAGASIISSSMYAAAPAMNPDGTPAMNADGTPVTTEGSNTAGSTSTSAPGMGSGTSSGTGPSFGGSTSGFGSSGSTSGFGSTSGSGFGSPTGGSFGPTGGTGSIMGNNGTVMAGTTGFGSASNSPFSSSTGGGAGMTFGGGGFIVGVTLPVKKPSLIDYKKQKNYNQWEFNYDPMEDQMKQVAGAGGGATNLNGATPTNGMPGIGNPNQGTSSPFSSGSGGPTGGPSFGGVPSSGGASGSTGSSNDGSSNGSSNDGSNNGSSNSGNSGNQQPPQANPQP